VAFIAVLLALPDCTILFQLWCKAFYCETPRTVHMSWY